MTIDIMRAVAEFTEKFGLTYDGPPRILPPELADLRRRRGREEVDEYKAASYRAQSLLDFGREQEPALIADELENMLDALVDQMYIAAGTALAHGFTPELFYEAFRRVHDANMAKVRAATPDDSKHGTTLDIVKPPGWSPPSHFDLVRKHAHRGDK